MKTRLMPLNELASGDLARWRELARSSLEPNPFFEPEYLLPMARGLGALDTVALAVVADGDAWTACMPVRRVGLWHRIPLPAMSVWRGKAAIPGLLGTPLIANGAAHDAAVALVANLAPARGTFFTAFEWLAGGGPVHQAVSQALAEVGLRSLRFERFERALLLRRPENDYLESTTRPKRRRQLRRRWCRLSEALGEEPRIIDRAGDDATVTQFIELEGQSRLAEGGDVLSLDPSRVRFFHEMCAGFAAQGRLQFLVLEAGGRPLAMKCNILADPGVFAYKMAYDENLGEFAPGLQLELAMFSVFHERPESHWIDSCAVAHNKTFNDLYPGRRTLVTLTSVQSSIRALAAVPALRGARRLREQRTER